MPGIYYPVCAVALQVRLEEFAGELPAEAQAVLGGAAGRFRWIPDGARFEQPAEQDGASVAASKRLTFEVVCIPQRLTVKRNSYRQADECSLTIPWDVMPLDIRAIRSIGVVAYMGTLPADEWADRMYAGVAPSAAVREKREATACYDVSDIMRPEFIRFCGFADEPAEEHTEGGDVLTLSARDWTGVLLDTPVPSSVYRDKGIDWNGPIEDVVVQVLGTLPAMSQVPVHLVGVEPGTTRTVRGQAHKAGKNPKRHGGGGGSGGKPGAHRAPKMAGENYWDLLTDITVENGFVLYADAWAAPAGQPPGRFVIRRPVDIYEPPARLPRWEFQAGRPGKTTIQPVEEPSFGTRKRPAPWDKTQKLEVPTMVYGWNLESLSFKRRLGRVKVPSVKLVCNEGKKALEYQYPEGTRASAVSPNGLWANEEVRVIPISGASSIEDLKAIAPQTFEEIGRGEMTMDLATQDLASLGGDNNDPDLLDLRPGTPLEVLFAQEAKDDTEGGSTGLRQRLLAMSESELSQWLQTFRSLPKAAADALARTLREPRARDLLCRRWYVREAEHTMDDGGYECRVQGINYVQARIDADKKRGA